MDKLVKIWDEIYALETLTDVQKYRVDCFAVQFYDIANNVYHTIATVTRNSDVRKKSQDYRAVWEELKERTGL
jgi:hypothetical protein